MSSTALKILALILMVIDHIGEFIPGVPIYFRWIGRISDPLFMFTMVWGFHYTRNRKIYLTRMYIFGVIMAILNLFLNNVIKNPYQRISNNIFVTLLLVAIIVFIKDRKSVDIEAGNKLIRKFILLQVVSTIIVILASKLLEIRGIELFIGAILPNLLFNEGSFIFVFLGVIMYYGHESKESIFKRYGLFCIAYFAFSILGCYGIANGNIIETVKHLFYDDYQWMMIASLPLMLLYNGRKGKGLKYLFYLFYPLHIVVLYLLGNLYF